MAQRVDKLEFLVLVDNSIERSQRLPPGFSHESPQHLHHHSNPVDELTGLPLTRFEDFCCGAHGSSILIKTTIGDEQFQVSFDTGPEGLSIRRNVEASDVDSTKLDAFVLSHWHRDHSGGISETSKMRNAQGAQTPSKSDSHPDRPIRRGLAPGPKYVPITNWLPDPSFSEMRASNGAPDSHAEGHEIKNAAGKGTGVYVSGEIPRVHSFEKGLPGAVTWMSNEDEKDANGFKAKGEEAMPTSGSEAQAAKPRGGWVTDESLKDERYVAVDVKGHGSVSFSACSHAGICNVISSTPDVFNKRPVHMVVGGSHSIPIETQPVTETVNFLGKRMSPRPDWIVPSHCTGVEARGKLIDEFGKQCIPSGVGIKVTVEGDEEKDRKLDDVDLVIK